MTARPIAALVVVLVLTAGPALAQPCQDGQGAWLGVCVPCPVAAEYGAVTSVPAGCVALGSGWLYTIEADAETRRRVEGARAEAATLREQRERCRADVVVCKRDAADMADAAAGELRAVLDAARASWWHPWAAGAVGVLLGGAMVTLW